MNQTGGIGQYQKAMPRITLESATIPSASIMTVRRLKRSIQTPANAPNMRNGSMETTAAMDSVRAD
ncbi:hypothetical protein DSECCO2_461570 [anaerobic digester metagenome]